MDGSVEKRCWPMLRVIKLRDSACCSNDYNGLETSIGMSGAVLHEVFGRTRTVLSRRKGKESLSRVNRSCSKSDRFLTLHINQNEEERTSFVEA